MLRSQIKPLHGTQPHFPGFSLTDKPTPLLLEEKGLGDEVHATEKGLGDEVHATEKGPVEYSVSLSVSIDEKGLGDEVHATEKGPVEYSVSLSVSIDEKGLGECSLSIE